MKKTVTFGSIVFCVGWSEPTTTNAPVEDEAVQVVLGVNQKHILPKDF